jgi:hypothetical protein
MVPAIVITKAPPFRWFTLNHIHLKHRHTDSKEAISCSCTPLFSLLLQEECQHKRDVYLQRDTIKRIAEDRPIQNNCLTPLLLNVSQVQALQEILILKTHWQHKIGSPPSL